VPALLLRAVLGTEDPTMISPSSSVAAATPSMPSLLALAKARFPQVPTQELTQQVVRSVERGGAARTWSALVASTECAGADAALTPLAAPAGPAPANAPRVGVPTQLRWAADVADGQCFQVEVSANARAEREVTQEVPVLDGERTRFEWTGRIVRPTAISFAYDAGASGELSFLIDRELQLTPSAGGGRREFRAALQPGEHAFTWIAGAASRVTIDALRIGAVSDARWTPVGSTEPGVTSIAWTPLVATPDAVVRVRADNGHRVGAWVQGAGFEVS
jgi:hypothetical protein